jgi:hypothetical protein
MSKIYTVCVSNVETEVTVSSTLLSSTRSYNYYTAGCNVEERYKFLRFTSTPSVPVEYTIWYTYLVTPSENVGSPYTLSGQVTMPAGQTTTEVEVLTFIEKDCPDPQSFSTVTGGASLQQ